MRNYFYTHVLSLRIYLKFLGLGFLFLLTVSTIGAQVIHLKNNQEIEGTLIEKKEESLVVQVPYGQISLLKKDLSIADQKKYFPDLLIENSALSQIKETKPQNPKSSNPVLSEEEQIVLKSISEEDRNYLKTVAFETWSFVSDFVDDKTGLPFDNSTRANYTSMSNIAVYLCGILVAQDLGFISRDDALFRTQQVIQSLEKHSKWKGFPASWVHVRSISSNDKKISVVDSGHLAASLMVLQVEFHELSAKIQKILDRMDWNVFYDPKTKWFRGGYDPVSKNFMDFYYPELGTDVRSASLVAIGSGKIPQEHWNYLLRVAEQRYGIQYLGPGWKKGGLFLHLMTGLFFDERQTLVGLASANAALAQMVHAEKNGFPLWGWSASLEPGGKYLGMNELIDDVVTPHASILALPYYPHKVIENMKQFDLLGVRDESSQHHQKKYGYRDAYGIEKQQMVQKYLMLDQNMILISIGNVLNQSIWRRMGQHPWTINLIKNMHILDNLEMPVKEIYQKRDKSKTWEDDLSFKLPITNIIIKPFVEIIAKKTNVFQTKPIKLDGDLNEWTHAEVMKYELEHSLEKGICINDDDLWVESRLLWDSKYLYIALEVQDQKIINPFHGDQIYKGDVVEIFIDPDKNKLIWGFARDFQIGISPVLEKKKIKTWAWFQHKEPLLEELNVYVKQTAKGYIIEAGIAWDFLGIEPKKGLSFGISPAIHDVDQDGFPDTKFNWCYFEKEKYLGDATLR